MRSTDHIGRIDESERIRAVCSVWFKGQGIQTLGLPSGWMLSVPREPSNPKEFTALVLRPGCHRVSDIDVKDAENTRVPERVRDGLPLHDRFG